jgi:3-phosphoshikimate 1-carboxyvinyltransferase
MLSPVPGLTAHIEGDPSLSRRPMKRVSQPLAAMGAQVSLTDAGTLPASVRGTSMHGVSHSLAMSSAQVKTSLLLAGLAADGETWVREPELSRDHTERLLPAFGVTLLRGPAGVGVRRQELSATELTVPGDPSSAAFFASAAALIPGADVRITGVGTNPTRTGILEALAAMGGPVTVDDETSAAEPYGTWRCTSQSLHGTTIAGAIVPRLIDEVPVLAVVASQATGETTIRDAGELRVKESDRLKLVAEGLRASSSEAGDRFVAHTSTPEWTTGSRCPSRSPGSSPTGRPSSRAPSGQTFPSPDSSDFSRN